MDAEIENFFKVWTAAILCQFYCYFLVSRIPSGFPRLISVLPIIYLFTTLPLNLHSFHLGGITIFYLVWLANFKLLLYSFNRGPLSSKPYSLSHFIAIGLLPIKTKTDPSHKTPSNPEIIRRRRQFKIRSKIIKVALFFIILRLYSFRPKLHPKFIMVLYCCHMYLGVEFQLAIAAIPIKVILGLESAKQFNEPYLSRSLQDFWGRRWNLMVTGILRETVYDPLRNLLTPVVGRYWSLVPANLLTFFLSGLMHEVLFYYLSRAWPTWEVTWFFVLQGVCVTCEVYVKKWVAGRWRLHRAVSGALTVAFVGLTGSWLFFPPLVRNGLDSRAIEEYYIVLRFVKNSFVVRT
ncbi:OLC1v1022606C1 [Oldenlandia corymbosa var. corymbosa]|uniref:OLC1v1022606C1 n=1 Tax=Oldenlandia corymbosa var. corymbosa TaxID=529605 RepID=A0AAV1BY95_OLDCO|nr:OLC1v1022606C1 [Oldenlandia corymbosa var. corymbosa]